MAYIAHRCTECNRVHCTCGKASRGPSEVIPTWDGACRPVTTLAEPGASVAGHKACTCQACKALFETESAERGITTPA